MADNRSDLNPLEAGAKYDGEKIRWELIPADAMEEIAKIYTLGARKYADRNWEKGIKYSRILGALKRHLNKYERGQVFDEENGQREAAAIAWNAIALLAYQLRGMDGGEFDDRPRAQFYANGAVSGSDRPATEGPAREVEGPADELRTEANVLGFLGPNLGALGALLGGRTTSPGTEKSIGAISGGSTGKAEKKGVK